MQPLEVSDQTFFMLSIVKIFFPPDKVVNFGKGVKYPISRVVLNVMPRQSKLDF